jgi:2'-5' RNA ligase
MDRRSLLGLVSAAMALGASRGTPSAEASGNLVAIDVLLEPDSALADRARALNARLRSSDTRGFALDATHVPHVTLVQQFMRREDVPRLGDVITRAIDGITMPTELRVTGIELSPWSGNTMVSLVIQRSMMLARLQAALVTSLIPLVAPAGDASAFVREPPDPQIDAATIDYVSSFLLKRTADNFQPHLTVGLATRSAAEALKGEPFEARSYGIERLAAYHIGEGGTARRRVWPST